MDFGVSGLHRMQRTEGVRAFCQDYGITTTEKSNLKYIYLSLFLLHILFRRFRCVDKRHD